MKIKNKVEVIDDFIPVEYQNLIYDVLMGGKDLEGADDNGFPWYFTEDVTAAGEYDSQHRPAFSHSYVTYYEDDDALPEPFIESDYHRLFVPMLRRVCKHLDIKGFNVTQGRSFLQLPLGLRSTTPDSPHIDMVDEDHLVALYYVCNSDGDTIIYNERQRSSNYTIKEKVTPKKGRIVLFDGKLYHTAEQPKFHSRCVANYNLIY
tara:strand:+ start:234 stop:848 length:615 start_codon:yes stop_codon:yes gene_type:complete